MCDRTFPLPLDKTMRSCDICRKNVHINCANIICIVPEVYLCFKCIKNKSDKI